MKCLEESGNIFSEKAQSDNEEMMQSSQRSNTTNRTGESPFLEETQGCDREN